MAVALVQAADARAAARLVVSAEPGAPLRLVVQNSGDEPASAVTPEVLYRHRSEQGAGADLAPGARHDWQFSLPEPPGPGTFPVIVRVAYTDGSRLRSIPLVTVIATPGAAAEPVRARLETTPIVGAGHATLVLENPGPRRAAGRAAFLLPAGLVTDPETVPAAVPAGERATVPLVLEDRDRLAPDHYPAFAVFEYDDGNAHHTALAVATIEVRAGRRSRRPLLLGLVALAAAVVVVAAASRAARRRNRG